MTKLSEVQKKFITELQNIPDYHSENYEMYWYVVKEISGEEIASSIFIEYTDADKKFSIKYLLEKYSYLIASYHTKKNILANIHLLHIFLNP